MVKPHGGELINKITPAKLRELENLQVLVLSKEQAKDVRNIAHGVYSPLTGFLGKEDFDSVVSNMRLADGTLWPIPIVLDINGSTKDRLDTHKVSLLVDETGNPFALMDNLEIYRPNKEKLAEAVYGTTDLAHPGVVSVKKWETFL